MNRSTPDLPVHHKPPESTQTHAHQVGDAIQPSHPLSSPSPPVPNPSQYQGLFQWVNFTTGQELAMDAKSRGWKFDEEQDIYSLKLFSHLLKGKQYLYNEEPREYLKWSK